MPELPEVENLRRGLEKNIIGQKILSVKVNKPKLVSGKGNIRVASKIKVKKFETDLGGEVFSQVERRAKNLIFRFRSGKVILAHLKMSGQFAYKAKSYKLKAVLGGPARNAYSIAFAGGHPIEISETLLPNKHTHIIFELNKGALYYNDTRMFGYLLYYPTVEAFEKENHFELYGLEPFDKKFSIPYLTESLKNKSGKIKAVLMNQNIVTGLGNIYADESLFEARIRPTRSASSLRPGEVKHLFAAILRIMKRAIKVGGSSVATYRLLDESRGNYAREHKVYGKVGEACPRCHRPFKKIIIQSRTTVYCSNCQK